VLVLVATAAIGACGAVPLPEQSPPDLVLNTYLDALEAGDCERARSLAMPTFVVGNGELCGALDVLAFSPLTGPATPRDGEVIFSTTLTTRGDGVSIEDGDTLWFYQLIRQPGGAWRLTGGGTGP